MAKLRSTRIVLVDDHDLVRQGLAALFDDVPDMDVCGEAAEYDEALRLIESEVPDIAIVDITLKGGSGLELIKQIEARFGSVKVLVLSMHDETLFAERVLRAGARGYLSKAEPGDKVVEAVREIVGGRIYLSNEVTDKILHRVVVGGEAETQSLVESLSDRELEVLELIGRGMTTRQIAEDLNLSKKTVDTYRDHLKKKLQLKTANELIRYAVTWTMGRQNGEQTNG
jgi:DNA-binding NarL/FixJ family response regulator